MWPEKGQCGGGDEERGGEGALRGRQGGPAKEVMTCGNHSGGSGGLGSSCITLRE